MFSRPAVSRSCPKFSFAALAFVLLWLCLAAPLPGLGQANVYTRSYNANRTGANLDETVLTPANVNPANFGKLYTVPLDAQVYAQPLYVSGVRIGERRHDVVLVASMRNTVYAIDAPTGAVLWQQTFGTPMNPQDVEVYTDIDFNTGIGILGTPVIDPVTNYMYFVSSIEYQAGGATVYEFHLNAIDIRTGEAVHGSPVNITASYSTSDLASPLIFVPKIENPRPGLALANGNVYMAFASHGDQGPYHGWVLAYSAATLQQTAVYADTTIGVEGGIWNAGAAPPVDAYGNLYYSTGNGSFGLTPNGRVETGNSFIKLSPTLELLDYFTPSNSAALNAGDQDLGSSGLLLLPGTSYLLGGGKQGVLYLVDGRSMTGFHASGDQILQEFQAIYGVGTSHIHGTPIFWESARHGTLTYVWGENDVLRAYPWSAETRRVATRPLMTSTMTAPVSENYGAMPGGFPTISANRNKNGILWASTPFIGNANQHPVPGVLYAFDADTLRLLWSDKMQEERDEVGMFAKFCPPVVANGRMFVPTFGSLSANPDGTGQLVAYGLLPLLTVSVANASVVQGSPLPAFSGTVSGLAPADTLGDSIVVTYSTTANSSSPAGTYPITATVSGTSAENYRVVIATGVLTLKQAHRPFAPRH